MENKFDLSACGVQEMEVEDMKKVDGGICGILEGVAIGLGILCGVAYIYDNAGDFLDGVSEGYNDQQNG